MTAAHVSDDADENTGTGTGTDTGTDTRPADARGGASAPAPSDTHTASFPPETGGGAARVESTADVDPTARLGSSTRVWHLAQIRENARLGEQCTIGRAAYIGPGVILGDRCKVQNAALVYEPAVLGDGVFVGPAVVFTNDLRPRAITPEGRLKTGDDWHAVGVRVADGASIGARAVCIAPITIGRWAMVAAGSVVTRDVPDHALVAGVPARRIGWVGRTGARLIPDGPDDLICPETGDRYREIDGSLTAVLPD